MGSKSGSTIVVIVNKSWEVLPFLSVLVRTEAVPNSIDVVFCSPPHQKSHFAPRAVLRCNGVEVTVWCIEDLVDRTIGSSVTSEKARVLSLLKQVHQNASFLVSVGTAASVESGFNGAVGLTERFFLHDPKIAAVTEPWNSDKVDTLVTSEDIFGLDKALSEIQDDVAKRLLVTPLKPAIQPIIVGGSGCVNISVINVSNSGDYASADQRGVEKFLACRTQSDLKPLSVETTHGTVCQVFQIPFLIVSGIANSIGQIESEVFPRKYAQNLVAAHNAGICASWILPHIADRFR